MLEETISNSIGRVKKLDTIKYTSDYKCQDGVEVCLSHTGMKSSTIPNY